MEALTNKFSTISLFLMESYLLMIQAMDFTWTWFFLVVHFKPREDLKG